MDTKNALNTAPIKPYDDSMWDSWSIYDNLPYVQDIGLRSEKSLAKVSGNIIKSCRCQIKEAYEVKH